MAVIAPVNTFPIETAQDVAVTLWSPMVLSDTATPVRLGLFSDRTVQVAGTFGGATLALAGSNDGTNYVTLYDAQGSPLSFTGAGLKAIVELPVFIKPILSGGDGTTSLAVTLAGRRSIR